MTGVSFLMPVYSRPVTQPYLVEEAVHWFLRQTWPRKELVILNDNPGVTVVCDAEEVRVVNHPKRFATLGEKRNALTELARYEICLPCDDDDVSLPLRAEQAVRKLQGLDDGGSACDYWTPGRWWFAGGHHCRVRQAANGWGANCCAYRRDRFLGAYQACSDEDMKLAGDVAAWEREGRVVVRHDPVGATEPGAIPYVYRFGVSRDHLSGGFPDIQGSYERMAVPAGGCTARLVPRAYTDWEAEVREAIALGV